MAKVSIIGAGSWGIAISLLLSTDHTITDMRLLYGQCSRMRLRCLMKRESILSHFPE